MTENRPKALIYCRVSSERQKNEGHGLDSQEHRCRVFAQQKGHDVEAVFSDSYTGGGDFTKRPAMSELLNYIDNNPIHNYVVIFDDLSRLARDVVAHAKLRDIFRQRGIIVLCPNFDFDDSPEGEFFENIVASRNQYDRKANRRQVIQKMKARLESGYWPFFPPPGYKAEKDPVHGMLLKFTDKAPIIKEVLEGFANFRFKEQEDVRKFLVEKDFCNGKPIYLTFIRRLLTREIYAGYIEYTPWEVSRRVGHHEPIISTEIFEAVQERLKGRVRNFTRKDTTLDFPQRGFVLCEGCNKPYTASWSTGRNKKFPYYRCNQLDCPFKNKSIKRDLMENAMGKLLKSIKPKEQILNYAEALFLEAWEKRMMLIEKANRSKEQELARVIAEKESYIQRIPKTNSEAVIQSYEKRIEELASRELDLNKDIENPKAKGINFGTALETVMAYIGNPHDKWENGNLNDKRLVLKLVFTDKLSFNREKGFGTAKFSLPIKAFELFSKSKSQGVEMERLNPRPKFRLLNVYLNS